MSETSSVDKVVIFEPLLNRILVQKVKAASMTESGLFLPGTQERRFEKCVVVAVGPGIKDDHGNHKPLTVKVGDVVYCGRFQMDEFDINEIAHALVHENDILGRVREVPADQAPHRYIESTNGKKCIKCQKTKLSKLHVVQ